MEDQHWCLCLGPGCRGFHLMLSLSRGTAVNIAAVGGAAALPATYLRAGVSSPLAIYDAVKLVDRRSPTMR